jgi:hypothetical protein
VAQFKKVAGETYQRRTGRRLVVFFIRFYNFT